MKIGKHLAALAACGALTGIAHAGPASPQAVVKKITLTAHIGDSLFVSKPDNSAWYDVVELNATDRAQQSFATTLPIRVRTTNPDINVTLVQPLRLSNGRDEMANAKVVLTGKAGDAEIASGAARTLTLVKPARGEFAGYDETRNLKVSAHVPVVSGATSTNGSYHGDLVLMFEPAASAGREPATGAVAAAGE
ncbi:CS1 type fimbrial major subunit [Burkholderia pyrrocinia]|uniref:CS1 type fimbrial major subunit n=1 Tax=Burkholderia pyrrocinia TaxID=60550 RepID=UPI00158AC57E|nr:CS1 type fimbrial major subunit [Burkholderia pyrrocinia]